MQHVEEKIKLHRYFYNLCRIFSVAINEHLVFRVICITFPNYLQINNDDKCELKETSSFELLALVLNLNSCVNPCLLHRG